MIDWGQVKTAESKAAKVVADVLSSALARNNAGYEAAITKMTAAYPPSEIATWERQRSEVMAWSLDSTTSTPWIDAAATARGINRELYLNKTLEKSNQFAAASAYLTGLRQRYETQVHAASLAVLPTMQFSYELPT